MTFDFLIDLFFPKICLNCHRYASDFLCEKCFSKIKLVQKDVCPVCEKLSLRGATHPGCRGKYTLDGLTVATDYANEVVQSLVHKFKYQGMTAAKDLIVEKILMPKLRQDSVWSPDKQKEVSSTEITFVPLHPDKERKRGFNQSEILAKELGKRLSIPVVNLLKRVKYNIPQMSIKDAQERKKNVRGIFHPSPLAIARGYGVAGSFLQDKFNVVLVDDVATTGATIKECCRVLKHAGADFVWGIVLARKQPQS